MDIYPYSQGMLFCWRIDINFNLSMDKKITSSIRCGVKSLIHSNSQTRTLQWRHNGHDGVSNHQPHDCWLNRLFRVDQRKHQSSALLAFVRGIHRWPVNSPHTWPVTRKMFPFDDVIMNQATTKQNANSNRVHNSGDTLWRYNTEVVHNPWWAVGSHMTFRVVINSRMMYPQVMIRNHRCVRN